MPAVFIASCAAAGFLVGVGLAAYSRHLTTFAPSTFWMIRLVAPLLTAVAFGDMAWRFGYRLDLLPCCVLAALGIILSLIDLVERRLPSVLTYAGLAIVGTLLVTSAILNSRGPDLLRALAGMATLAAFYLVLALISGGGLGAGDVKLGGLLGLALGWLSWSALLTATLLGWLAAAAAWLLMRLVRRKRSDSLMPMGPFLLIGALLTISAMPA
jgi:leader peptidase (prepilin peptidase)/N-methyltransferase